MKPRGSAMGMPSARSFRTSASMRALHRATASAAASKSSAPFAQERACSEFRRSRAISFEGDDEPCAVLAYELGGHDPGLRRCREGVMKACLNPFECRLDPERHSRDRPLHVVAFRLHDAHVLKHGEGRVRLLSGLNAQNLSAELCSPQPRRNPDRECRRRSRVVPRQPLERAYPWQSCGRKGDAPRGRSQARRRRSG